MELIEGDYKISDDKGLLSLDRISEFLADSYWARDRSRKEIELSIENSICYGVYDKDKQVGFARVVTDGATMYWLCDVYIDREYRRRGLGKKLVQFVVNSDRFKGMHGILGTKDAHGLYKKYGFKVEPETFMRLKPQE